MSAQIPTSWRGNSAEGWAAALGVPRFELHGELPSTNDLLRELAREGAPPLTTVVAGRQTRGRGRGGRGWHSPSDSGLWISVLLASGPGGGTGVLPLAVGVAVARALERFSADPIWLKWPNDLLLGAGKIAGILCEATGEPSDGIVVGIGVNLRRDTFGEPGALELAPAFLEEGARGIVYEPELARALLGEIRRWATPVPTALEGRLREEWEARDRLCGEWVRLEGGGRGRSEGIGADGALRVILEEGRRVEVRSGGVRLDGEGGSSALHRFDTARR